MKQVLRDRIINIDENLFDNKFLFEIISWYLLNSKNNLEIIYISDLLEKRKNIEILDKVKEKPVIYSNVYSSKDELEIFTELFEDALKNNKRIHIVWITLREEVELLEKYYEELWFLREDINCFDVDFNIPLVTASVCIENIMWKWSDYKAYREKIFFNPPIRESWQVKAMFKWINRWSIAWIYIKNFDENIVNFLSNQVKEENILPITLAKVLKYNFDDIWIIWNSEKLEIEY